MIIEKISRALGVEPWRIKGALDRHTIRIVKDFTPNYIVFKKSLGQIERGTSVFLNDDLDVVPGFPKIQRAFYLRPVVERHFGEKIAVEEKMNGYNVRAFLVNNKVYALTRGGFICPYTTAKLREISGIKKFLSDHNVVLCGEVVGMENPYVIHEYPEAGKFGFFVFDIREKKSNDPKPIQERNSLLDAYGIRYVRLIGIFKKAIVVEEIFKIIKELEKENREGVVLKDPDMKIPPIKYTSSKTNTSDLAYAFRFPYDYGRDFFFSRIMREGYQALELEEEEDDLKKRALRLGESLLYPMVETMKKIKKGEIVTEDFTVRVNSRREISKIETYLRRQGVDVNIVDIREEENGFVARVKRMRHSTNDKIRSLLSGKIE